MLQRLRGHQIPTHQPDLLPENTARKHFRIAGPVLTNSINRLTYRIISALSKSKNATRPSNCSVVVFERISSIRNEAVDSRWGVVRQHRGQYLSSGVDRLE